MWGQKQSLGGGHGPRDIGQPPPEAMESFCAMFVIFRKNSYFKAIWIKFCMFLESFERKKK